MTECRLQPVQIKSNGQREGGKEARLGFRHQRLADPATFVTATHKQMSNETDCRENKQTKKQETLQKRNKKEEKKAREVRKLHDKLMTKTTNGTHTHTHTQKRTPTHTHRQTASLEPSLPENIRIYCLPSCYCFIPLGFHCCCCCNFPVLSSAVCLAQGFNALKQ